MRTKNAIISSFFGILNVMLKMFAAFFMRKLFLQHFSAEYLGLYYIFNSIFGILVALDCGISSSVFFKIYKPIESGDKNGTASIFALVRLVYTIRGFAVFIVGTCIYFFLPFFVKPSTLNYEYIKKCYIIYMLCNSANYLVIFYQFFLETIQKRYIVSIVDLIIYVFGIIAKLFFIFRNKYIPYLMVDVSSGIIINFVCWFITYKKYPYLRGKLKIKAEDKKGFVTMVGMAFHSLSTVIATYTDIFLISIFSGIYQTGLYGNYKTLNNTVQTFVNQITSSTKDSMRSLIATGEKRRITEHLYNLTFLMFWIGGVCCVCLSSLSSKIVSLWLGDEYLMSPFVIITTVIALYMSFQNFFIVDSYYATECFLKDKKSPIIEIFVNLILSIILGKIYGISGVMVGTIGYYTVQTILRTFKLFINKLEKEENKLFIKKLIKYSITAIVCSILGYFVSLYSILPIKIMDFLLDAIIVFIGVNLIFLLFYHKENEFIFFRNLVLDFIKKINIKIKKNC